MRVSFQTGVDSDLVTGEATEVLWAHRLFEMTCIVVFWCIIVLEVYKMVNRAHKGME